MSRGVTSTQAAWAVLGLAVAQLGLQAALLARGVEYIAVSLTIDDTYYYLQTAWNTKQLGFVTFDGIHATNGVQLLWFAITLVLAMLVETKVGLLLAAMTLCFLLNAICYLFILKIGAVLRRPALALLMAGLWALQSLPFRVYSMGMENSLHALVFWGALWQSAVFLVRVREGRQPNVWGLTIILILNAWTRVESALHSVLLFAVCLAALVYAHRRVVNSLLQRVGGTIAGSIALAGAGFAAQLLVFRLMGDSFLPVSALIKTGGASRGWGAGSIAELAEVFVLGMPTILQGRLPAYALILFGIVGILLLMRAWATRHALPGGLQTFLALWLSLLAGEIGYHAYIAVSGIDYRPYFVWYRTPSFIFWIVTASLIGLLALERLARARPRLAALRWAPLGGSLLCVAVAVYMFVRAVSFTSPLYSARYEAALWIAEHSPPDAVFAAWNAGQLGYFSERTVINLDGMINSLEYYERVLRGPVPLTDYLIANNVAYLVDYAVYASIPDFPIIRTFPVNDGTDRSIQIWQVIPRPSSAS